LTDLVKNIQSTIDAAINALGKISGKKIPAFGLVNEVTE